MQSSKNRILNKRTSAQQLEIMVQFMEDHPLFARGQIPKLGPRGAEKYKKIWQKLAEKLNQVGPTIKDVKGWKETWKNVRLSCKKKRATYITQCRRTGNAEITVEVPSQFEDRVSAIFGNYGNGLPIVPELGLNKKKVSPHVAQQHIICHASHQIKQEQKMQDEIPPFEPQQNERNEFMGMDYQAGINE